MDLVPGSVYEFDSDWILITNLKLVGANVTVSSFVPKGSPFDFCWHVTGVDPITIRQSLIPSSLRPLSSQDEVE